MNDQRLSELLQRPAVPASLARRIHHNWEQQRGNHPRSPGLRRWIRHLSLAASLAAGALLAGFYLHTPAIIDAAYADVQKDAALTTGLVSAQSNWLATHGIHPPPQNMPVELSKFCYLGQQRSTHLRIAGKAQGIVHVFLYTGARPALWGREEGRLHELHWKILTVRNDLNLLILHTDDMQPQGIARLLDTMLADVAAATA